MHGKRKNGGLCEPSIPTSLLRCMCKLAAVNESGTKRLYITLMPNSGGMTKHQLQVSITNGGGNTNLKYHIFVKPLSHCSPPSIRSPFCILKL